MKKTKALAVRQPYAEQIASGRKRIEYRTWNTHHRGPLAIVAPLRLADGASKREHGHLPRGFVVCIVDVVDVRGERGAYEWVLARPRRVRPLACKARLRLFNVNVRAA